MLIPYNHLFVACPSGCLACAIPSFSIASVWNDTLCTACQEGWVLQEGKCVEECAAGSFLPEGPPNINGTCEGQLSTLTDGFGYPILTGISTSLCENSLRQDKMRLVLH